MAAQLQSVLGLVVIPVLAWLLCARAERLDGKVALRAALVALALQFAIAGVFLLIPALRSAFQVLAGGVAALQAASNEGMKLVFGYLAGAPAPFAVVHPQNGFVLGMQALPLILVVSVLAKLLYHWGILQKVVGAMAWGLQRTMGVSGPLGTAAAANVFVGMVEAPLLIRPYICTMSRSALFATMTAGMATVAGTVMALYASLLADSLPGAAGHVLVASLISAPAALLLARLMVPGNREDEGVRAGGPDADRKDSALGARGTASIMDAVAQGTTEGLRLLAYVIAMLVVMVSLVALVNAMLAAIGAPLGINVKIEQLLGYVAAPFAWLIGIPWSEAVVSGELIGVKAVLNEFLAYLKLAQLPADVLSERSRLILTYALCGFANFGSLGIMTGGLVAMAPERRDDILSLGPKALVSGLLATMMTGAVAGVLTAP